MIMNVGQTLNATADHKVELICRFSYYQLENNKTRPLTIRWDPSVMEKSSIVHNVSMRDENNRTYEQVSSLLTFTALSEYDGKHIVCKVMYENIIVMSTETISIIISNKPSLSPTSTAQTQPPIINLIQTLLILVSASYVVGVSLKLFLMSGLILWNRNYEEGNTAVFSKENIHLKAMRYEMLLWNETMKWFNVTKSICGIYISLSLYFICFKLAANISTSQNRDYQFQLKFQISMLLRFFHAIISLKFANCCFYFSKVVLIRWIESNFFVTKIFHGVIRLENDNFSSFARRCYQVSRNTLLRLRCRYDYQS